MNPTITTEIVVAYAHCPRKAFLLLTGVESGPAHEYVQILATSHLFVRKHLPGWGLNSRSNVL